MKILRVQIENYRALKVLDVYLSQCNIVIGENDTGKTSFLYALERFFAGKKIADVDEFFQKDQTKEITVTVDLEIANPSEEEKLFLHSEKFIRAKKVFAFDKSVATFLIKTDGSAVACPKTVLSTRLGENNFHLIPVRRDLAVQFSMNKTALLGRVLRAAMKKRLELPEAAGRNEALAKELLDALNGPRATMEGLFREQVNNKKFDLTFDNFSVDPIEGVSFEVRLSDEKVGSTPIENRGAGTQNNLIIALFRMIAKEDLGDSFVLAMEEPENSLHPKAQRQLFSVLQELSGGVQTIITTHSPVFIDRSRFESNIFLTRQSDGRTIAKSFNKALLGEVREALDLKVSDALLKGGGNCAFIVEGKTEEDGVPTMLEMVGLSEFQLGLSIIGAGGSDLTKIRTRVQLLGSYEVPCVVMLDRDAATVAENLERERDKGTLKNLVYVHVLKKGVIEDYYPNDIVAEVINGEFEPKIKVVPEMFDSSKSGSARIKDIQKVMHDCGAVQNIEYLKSRLGLIGTRLMKERKVALDGEIEGVLQRVAKIARS